MRHLPGRPRRALRSQIPAAHHLELERPIFIRRSGVSDKAALERLAALDSRKLPEGSFLLAEVEGELVAAAPLDVDAEPIRDPFRPTSNIRKLLRLQAAHIRRHRTALIRDREATARALPDPRGPDLSTGRE